MSEEKSGLGYGTIEHTQITILIIGGTDRGNESEAVHASLSPRHHSHVYAPSKTSFFTKFSAAKAVNELNPHIIHAIGLDGAAKSAMTLANGTDTALVISLNADDIEHHKPKHILRSAAQAGAMVVNEETHADKLRSLGVNCDIYVTASPSMGDRESQRFYLGAIEIVYGRIVDVEKLPEAPLDCDGSQLVSIGGTSLGKKS